MHTLRNRIFTLAVLAFGAWSGEAAAVFCPIQPFHVTLWVGDTASHAMCNFDTIQQAVDAVQCPNTVIVLTHEHTYTSQHITINNKPSMTLAGVDVPVACGTDPPAGSSFQRQIDGGGNGNRSVFSITNSDVTLKNLDISGGHTTINARGGGISAAGSSHITLQQSTVEDNSADFGGGVAVVDTGTLTMGDHAGIITNTARANGGGVFLAGSAHMDMRGAQATIASNQATGHDGDFGYGGGVFVTNNAIADITGTIGFNSARAGGGVAALGGNGGNSGVHLFSVDPARPVLVLENGASVHGGGLYSNSVFGSLGVVCAQDFRIVNNRAPDGAAMYGVDDENNIYGDIFLNVHDLTANSPCTGGALSAAGIGPSVCVAGQSIPCNEISGNQALTAAGNASGGAVIAGTHPWISRANMRGNDGGSMISAEASYLSDSLIADNHSTHEILHSNGVTFIQNTTIANNTIDNGYVFFGKLYFRLLNSLVWQPGHQTLDYQLDGCDDSQCPDVGNVLTNDATGIGDAGSVVVVQDMGFVDGDNAVIERRNYHIGAWMLNGAPLIPQAIDFAEPASGDDRDLDNRPHDQDIPIAQDFFGTRDLGCYELQASQFISDRIFADGLGNRISLLH